MVHSPDSSNFRGRGKTYDRQKPYRRRSRSTSQPRPSRHERDRSRSPYSHPRGSERRSHRDRRWNSRSRSRSRDGKRRRKSISHSRSPPLQRSHKALPSQEQSYRGNQGDGDTPGGEEQPVEKPNFKPTGLLAADSNKVEVGNGKKPRSIALKYHEPAEARKPPLSEQWMLYVFKGESSEPVLTVPLHAKSCWLLGRETAVADIPIEHPSCSKQHAVFQFRYVMKKNEWGEQKGKVGLYLLDLESANGTKLNDETVDAARYVQCISGDVVKFGDSEREYVILLPPKT